MTKKVPTTSAVHDAVVPADPVGTGRTLGLEVVAYTLLWLILAAVVFLNKFGEFTPDIKPEIYLAPQRSATDLLSSWFEDQQLGLPNFNVGLAPVAGFVSLLQGLGLDAAISMRVLRLLLLTTAGWGACRLFTHVAGDRATPLARVLVSVLYVTNPYVVVAGDTLAIALPLALLPWQILFLIRSLEQGGWRWPAAFALTFVAMTGMNVGVIPLIQLVYVPAAVWYVLESRRTHLRSAVASLVRCAALTVLVSLFWLVPGIAARGVGYNVVNNSETYRGIAAPSSFSEILRGLGLWVMYGRGQGGPWQPGFLSYLSDPLVIVCSFTLPILFVASALVVRRTLRRLALRMVCVAAVLMVGLYPPNRPSPIGHAMRLVFDHVPGAAAFRTTNKAGAVLILGMALLVAAGSATISRQRHLHGQVALGAALAALVIGAWPAFSGTLYSDQMTIPAYWRQAAAAVDKGSANQRVWLIPGEVNSHYRWSEERVDDIDKALLARPSVVHYTIPNAAPESANFMSAIDTLMQEGAMPPGAVSSAATYMGVSDVLARNDLVWEQTGGARPSVVEDQLRSDGGMAPIGTFGRPGENTVSTVRPPVSAFEAALPPLQRYRLVRGREMLRVEPLAGSVLIDGDGWALAPLQSAGLLPGQPVFRYLGEMNSVQLSQALKAGTRLVMTDTNRRRSALTDRLTNGQGPLLGPETDPGGSRVLFTDPDKQTVLRVEGGSVTTTSAGSVFGALPYASPENAVDGDERTAWVFGDFGHAVGQSLHLRLLSAQPISRVRLAMRGGPVSISRVRLQIGYVQRTISVPTSGHIEVALPPTTASTVGLTVLNTRGVGTNPVGINEIGIPGVKTVRVARLPTQLGGLAEELDSTNLSRLQLTPVDVVLSRVRGTREAGDDEETGLNRDFTLPRAGQVRLYGLIRPDEAAADDRIDALLGFSGNAVASSSSRLFGSPVVRASFAVDGNPFTGWSPGGAVVGESLVIRGTSHEIDHIDVLQPGAAGNRGSYASRMQVYLDGRLVAEPAFHPGLTRVQVPHQTTRELKLVITARKGVGFVNISEVKFADARIEKNVSAALHDCVPVAELDGRVLSMRPVEALTAMSPSIFAGCGGPLTLAKGPHRLRALHDWMPDELVLRDVLGENRLPTRSVLAGSRAVRLSATHWRISATLPPGPQVIVLGQNYDPRWTATIDGHSLGKPVVADGYSAAWIVDAAGKQTVDIIFAPQRRATVALVLSVVGVLLCLMLAFWRRATIPVTAPLLAKRPVRKARTYLPAPFRWGLGVATAWLIGGLLLGCLAAVLAIWLWWRPPTSRRLIQLSLVLVAASPVAFVLGNLSRWGEISPDLVLKNPLPHWLAASGAMILVVAVIREDASADTRAATTP